MIDFSQFNEYNNKLRKIIRDILVKYYIAGIIDMRNPDDDTVYFYIGESNNNEVEVCYYTSDAYYNTIWISFEEIEEKMKRR